MMCFKPAGSSMRVAIGPERDPHPIQISSTENTLKTSNFQAIYQTGVVNRSGEYGPGENAPGPLGAEAG